MKFAVNYSVSLESLLKDEDLPIDLIKCPEWDGMIQQALIYRPVYVHFEIFVGNGQLESLDFEDIKRIKKLTNTECINAHLMTNNVLNPNKKEDEHKMLADWEKELGLLSEIFGANNIVVENLPFLPYLPAQELGVQPENIKYIVNNIGCAFLLDISHARITASYLGWDSKDYIKSLPMNKLREVHVTGIRRYNSYLTDHFDLQESDWSFTRWVIEEIRCGKWPEPSIVSFEYGGVGEIFAWRSDINVLRQQIPKLAELIHQNN